jgi:colanic acid biosynthesis glycosyl transferase WcaI
VEILIASCVYLPEPVVSAQTSAQVARHLACSGHLVTVVTSFPNRPAGRVFPGFVRKLVPRIRSENGITILRCFSTLSGESRLLSRLAENLSFGLTTGCLILTCKKPDVIYANTWPVLAAGILVFAAWLRRIPVVMSVQDLYPESLIVQGRVRENGLIARLLRWIDGAIARRCRKIIVISKTFYRAYREARGVEEGKLEVVPNWIDTSSLNISLQDSKRYRASKGIGADGFVCVYAGNVGAAAGVEGVIEAFDLIGDRRDAWLIIAGHGSRLAACREQVKTIGSNRILFHVPYPKDDEGMVLGAADVLILPTKGEQSRASVPSKLLTYMLGGRPIIAAALPGTELAHLVEKAGCGWVLLPDRPDLLAQKILEVMEIGYEERKEIGERGRQYVMKHFSKDVCLPQVIRIIENATR